MAHDPADRLRRLARTQGRHRAELLHLLVPFDDQKLYQRDGCRSMVMWMDVQLGIARINACEQLRVTHALCDLPVLDALFSLGKISFSQLREVTRVATAANDAEFALASLELSVSETREYCRRFRHESDRKEDSATMTKPRARQSAWRLMQASRCWQLMRTARSLARQMSCSSFTAWQPAILHAGYWLRL